MRLTRRRGLVEVRGDVRRHEGADRLPRAQFPVRGADGGRAVVIPLPQDRGDHRIGGIPLLEEERLLVVRDLEVGAVLVLGTLDLGGGKVAERAGRSNGRRGRRRGHHRDHARAGRTGRYGERAETHHRRHGRRELCRKLDRGGWSVVGSSVEAPLADRRAEHAVGRGGRRIEGDRHSVGVGPHVVGSESLEVRDRARVRRLRGRKCVVKLARRKIVLVLGRGWIAQGDQQTGELARVGVAEGDEDGERGRERPSGRHRTGEAVSCLRVRRRDVGLVDQRRDRRKRRDRSVPDGHRRDPATPHRAGSERAREEHRDRDRRPDPSEPRRGRPRAGREGPVHRRTY